MPKSILHKTSRSLLMIDQYGVLKVTITEPCGMFIVILNKQSWN